MPNRPREHVIEDLARTQLHHAFAKVGWTCEDLDKDYGEDLLVRIFERGTATPWSFYVQSKATDNLDRWLAKDRASISFPVSSGHLEHWERFWEPVVLAVYDATTETTYWEVIQTYLESIEKRTTARPRKSISVSVPTDNLLDSEGLQRLKNRTMRRFQRLEAQKEGAQILIEELRKIWGVDIEYGPEFGILILPKGKFRKDPSGGQIVAAFGQFAAHLDSLKKKYGIDPHDAFSGSIDLMSKVVMAYDDGGKIQVRDKAGHITQEWATLEDLLRQAKRQFELDDE